MERNKLLNVFDNNKSSKPTGIVAFSRIPSFDPVERVDKLEIVKTQPIKYKGTIVKFERPILSYVDQKVFHTLLKTGKFIRETDDGFVFEYDFAEVKRVAGLNRSLNWNKFKDSLNRIKYISLEIFRETNNEKITTITFVITKFDIVEKKDRSYLRFYVTFSKEFIYLIKKSDLFNVPLSTLIELNSIKNPIVYRILTFFITQTKKQSWELFSLLERLTVIKFDTRKKRHKVISSIEENKDVLERYGITPVELKEKRRKTFILNFHKPHNLKLEIAKHC